MVCLYPSRASNRHYHSTIQTTFIKNSSRIHQELIKHSIIFIRSSNVQGVVVHHHSSIVIPSFDIHPLFIKLQLILVNEFHHLFVYLHPLSFIFGSLRTLRSKILILVFKDPYIVCNVIIFDPIMHHIYIKA